ncbi:putative reverse transcriptase domain-containing protein [Tanacetum coccineum]
MCLGIREPTDVTMSDSDVGVRNISRAYPEALVSLEAWAHSMGLSSAVHYELQRYRTHVWMQDHRINAQESQIAALTAQVSSLVDICENSDRRDSRLQAREQLVRIGGSEDTGSSFLDVVLCYVDLNSVMCCDPSHNNMPPKRTSAATKTARAAAAATAVEQLNQVKFATCTFIGSALTWWKSHKKAVTQDVAYAMDWKALKKMMTSSRGIEKTKRSNMPKGESDEVEKYVSGLPDMIRGNGCHIDPRQWKRQAEQKRKIEFNAGNNQGYQQQNKRQNTGRAYTAGTGEKREYTGSLPLCTKCNYHHKGPCAPRCNKCKRIGHLARDCRSSGPNNNNNNRCGNPEATLNAANITAKETEDRSGEKRLEDVPIVRDFPEHEHRIQWLLKIRIMVGLSSTCRVREEDIPKTAFYRLSAPNLALPQGAENFIVYCDTSHKGLGAVLMQNKKWWFALKFWGRQYLFETIMYGVPDLMSLQIPYLTKREMNMRQRRWLELLSDYDCEIRYHPGKANLMADALSRKERSKPLRVRALVMNIGLDIPKTNLECSD